MHSTQSADTCGFCYVANTAAYLAEALLSITSLKHHMPEARVCVIAPAALQQPHPLIADWRAPTLGDKTPIVKNDATLAPYDRVVFVDTDTRFLAPMMDVFPILDGFDLAAAHEPTRGWDYPTPAPAAFCELNTGVLVFKNTPKIREFFGFWLNEYRRLMAEQNLRNDQPAFRNALWLNPSIRLATLPPEFHCIIGKPVSLAWEARLIHDRGSNLTFVNAELNRTVGYRAFLPGLGSFFPFCGRRQWIRQWGRLSANWLLVLINPNRLKGSARQAKPHQWHLGETPAEKKS